jgi:hypothetical protein
MIRTPLSSPDASERAQFLKLIVWLVPSGIFVAMLAELFAYATSRIGGGVLLTLVLLNPFIMFGAALVVFWFMDRWAAGFAQMVFAGGNLRHEAEHSGIESLVARGFYQEAADAYRAHLGSHPGDHAARFKLAELYRAQLVAPDEAERLYLEIRQGKPTARQEMLSSNMLIELYRATGRRDRLVVELARFADKWKGTRAGESAAMALREVKEAMKEESPPLPPDS